MTTVPLSLLFNMLPYNRVPNQDELEDKVAEFDGNAGRLIIIINAELLEIRYPPTYSIPRKLRKLRKKFDKIGRKKWPREALDLASVIYRPEELAGADKVHAKQIADNIVLVITRVLEGGPDESDESDSDATDSDYPSSLDLGDDYSDDDDDDMPAYINPGFNENIYNDEPVVYGAVFRMKPGMRVKVETIQQVESLLLIENTVIDTKKLREACSYGIPDSLRPLCWRLFLDYLPRDRPNWKVVLAQQRAGYADLVENLIVTPGEQEDRHSAATTSSEVTVHPLSETSTTSEFRENEILIQIDRDVRRLRPEIQFFQKNTDYPFKSAARINLAKRISRDRLAVDEDPLSKMSDRSFPKSSEMTDESQTPAVPVKTAEEQDPECELHWPVVERMLFIYSKVNPGIKYVQGMNELIGPIYYVFATDPDREWAEHAEADTFYCFQHLRSEIKDNFIKKLDKSNCGIEIMINKFHERLAVQDPALYHHIAETHQIKPQFYVFRWILLLLSQEFSLPDLITLWDAVFASTDRIDCVQSICLVMLNEIREDLAGDFSANMRLLQDYPNNIDVANIMIKAYDFRHKKVSNTSARSNSASDTSDISFNSSSQSLTRAADRISAFMTGAKARINQYTNKKKDNS